jgi:hypothetical protein
MGCLKEIIPWAVSEWSISHGQWLQGSEEKEIAAPLPMKELDSSLSLPCGRK